MQLPVRVEQTNGEFTAYVLGSPDWHAKHATAEGAVVALRLVVAEKVERHEIATIDVPADGWVAAFGKFRDDPTILEICEEAYRERDRERDELFKE